MNLQEFFLKFQGEKFDGVKEMTSAFNELKVVERKAFLKELSGEEYKNDIVNISLHFFLKDV